MPAFLKENPGREDWAKEMCRLISESTMFTECRNKVADWESFYDDCIYDACGCSQGGDCECLCTAISNFAAACNQAGSPVYWRGNALCRKLMLLSILSNIVIM